MINHTQKYSIVNDGKNIGRCHRMHQLTNCFRRTCRKPKGLRHFVVKFPVLFWVLSISTVRNTSTRSSHPEVSLGKGVLKICSKYTGEQPCLSGISLKLQSSFIETHFGMGVLLSNCCIFPEHLFLRARLVGCL